MPWVAIVLFIALVIAFYYFWRSKKERFGALPSEDQPQVFDFEEQKGVLALARRKIRIVVPQQTIDGKRQKVIVELKPLPVVDKLQAPPEKKIDALLVAVANPFIYAADTRSQIVKFDPPLTVTISYKREDAAMTKPDARGAPQLSIITVYESTNGWRFEKLLTTVEPEAERGGGSLTAQLNNLEPNDPVWIGVP